MLASILKIFFCKTVFFVAIILYYIKKFSLHFFFKKTGKEQQNMGVRDRDAAARNFF